MFSHKKHIHLCITHIGRFFERLEPLLFERESAEGERRILVVLQLRLNLLNLFIALWIKGGGLGEWRTWGALLRIRGEITENEDELF